MLEDTLEGSSSPLPSIQTTPKPKSPSPVKMQVIGRDQLAKSLQKSSTHDGQIVLEPPPERSLNSFTNDAQSVLEPPPGRSFESSAHDGQTVLEPSPERFRNYESTSV